MKKVYKKPMIVIESFQLDAGVAACEGINIHKAESECEFDAGSMVYFTSTNLDCNFDAVNPNEFGDDLCYHGYNSGGLTFIAS